MGTRYRGEEPCSTAHENTWRFSSRCRRSLGHQEIHDCGRHGRGLSNPQLVAKRAVNKTQYDQLDVANGAWAGRLEVSWQDVDEAKRVF